MCSFSSYAQYSCKECIYDLYKVLRLHPSNSIDLGNNYTCSVKSLYQGKSDSIILAAITKARVFSYGNPLDSVIELNLGDKALYFMVNTEPPRSFNYSDINCVYDSKGRNLMEKEDYLRFPAVINDPEGFTYVREKPSLKSIKKARILKNQIFLYTPIWNGTWYRVYSIDRNLFIGYMYSKRILPYEKCPSNIKKKMTKLIFD